MRALNLEQLLSALPAELKVKVLSTLKTDFTEIATDSRKKISGSLFVALKGENFDAHQFLQQAVDQGAAALLVHQAPPELLHKKVTVIQVSDTLQALQMMATHFRRKSKAIYVGLTGSNGKTTSKEFSAEVLKVAKKTYFNPGSFNNHWGVPMSLLSVPANTEVALIEMGMNHAFEIEKLCQIAQPDVVVCTMVGTAHIENFGSQEKIAAAKEEIYESVSPSAKRIFNLDNPWTIKMYERALKKYPTQALFTFSEQQKSADVSFQILKMDREKLSIKGHIRNSENKIELEVFGTQNLTNLMVAASVGLACGLNPDTIWLGLLGCKTIWGRNQFLPIPGAGEILFDGYNANPDSFKALLDNLQFLDLSIPKFAVFAQMLELGNQSEKFHFELGVQCGKVPFEGIYFYGPDSSAFEKGVKSSRSFQGSEKTLIVSDTYKEDLALQAIPVLRNLSYQKNFIIAVKGSRGMKLEKFVASLLGPEFSLDKKQ